MPSIGVLSRISRTTWAGLDVVDRRARLDDQPVGERGLGEGLDVVGDDVVARAGRPGPGRAVERDRPARRGAEIDVGMVPRGVDDADDVVGDGRVDVDLADGGLQLAQLLDAEDLLELLERVGALLLVEDDDLLDRLGIAQADAGA